MTEINGKTAIVTGGASGIGKALCMELAGAGAKVIVADLTLEKAETVAAAVRAEKGEAVAIAADVCERDSIRILRQQAEEAFGPVQLLFANAGATSFERLADMSEGDVDWLFQVNLMGVVHCVQEFLPAMSVAGSGHIVATASMSGLLPSWVPRQSCYASAKAGIIGFILNLRYELAAQGIGASVLCPGPVSTGMKDNNGLYRPAKFGGPMAGPVNLPADFTQDPNQTVDFLDPADVARMTLLAVRENFPIIVTHGDDRHHFRTTHSDVVELAFGRAAEFASQR